MGIEDLYLPSGIRLLGELRSLTEPLTGLTSSVAVTFGFCVKELTSPGAR